MHKRQGGYVYILGLCLTVVVLAGVGCSNNDPEPIAKAKPQKSDLYGELYFSGSWADVPGTYMIDLQAQHITHISSLVGVNLQTTGLDGRIFLRDADNQLWLLNAFDGAATTVGEATDAWLAPNGRKFFYHDPSDAGLYEGAVGGLGGRLFAADGRYGAHSPSMRLVAYLNAQGLVIADADNAESMQVDLTGVLNAGESFVVPESGDYFPRWSPDEGLLMAILTVQDQAGATKTVGVLVGAAGNFLFYLANGPTTPEWSPDSNLLYYVSATIVYYVDLEAAENVLVSNSSQMTDGLRASPDGAYLGFVQLEASNAYAAVGFRQDTQSLWRVLPEGQNHAQSLDWARDGYCAETTNEAPAVSQVAVLIDGSSQDNPTITPETDAVIQVRATDADCNLQNGVALAALGTGETRMLSVNLPAGAGCDGQPLLLAPPALPDGSYNLGVIVEDICGAQSEPLALAVSFSGMSDDDDDDDDDDDTSPADDDDDDNDDTSPADDDDDDDDDDDNDTSAAAVFD